MAALASLPAELRQRQEQHVVLLPGRRQVLVLDNGHLRMAFPAAVGMPGWDTPIGGFQVMEKIDNPVWVHPVTGERVEEQGPDNPLGSHWIGFHHDCRGRDGYDGDRWITIEGAPPLAFTAHPTAGRSVAPSPMAASALQRGCRPSLSPRATGHACDCSSLNRRFGISP